MCAAMSGDNTCCSTIAMWERRRPVFLWILLILLLACPLQRAESGRLHRRGQQTTDRKGKRVTAALTTKKGAKK